MRRIVPALALLLGLSGCSDVCASFDGQTCVSVHLRANAPLSFDQISLSTREGFALADQRTPATPLAPPGSLPASIALLPPADWSGSFVLQARALVAGAVVGSGEADGTLTRGAHTSLAILLGAGEISSPPDAAVADGSLPVEDLAATPSDAAPSDAGPAADQPLSDAAPPVDRAFDSNATLDLATIDLVTVDRAASADAASPDLATAPKDLSAPPPDMAGAKTLSFALPRSYLLDWRPWQAAAGDFDGNGEVDVLALDQTGFVLFARDTGDIFPEAIVGETAKLFAAGDLNADKALDLVLVGDGGITLLLGNGNSTFKAPRVLSKDAGFVAVRIVDLDGDTQPDVVAVNTKAGATAVLSFLGPGYTTTPTTKSYNVIASAPTSLAVGDVNADGRPDLALLSGLSAAVLEGNGDGSFSTNLSPVTLTAAGGEPRSLAIADLDGDGKNDLAFVDHKDGKLGVARGTGGGLFAAPTLTAVSAGPTLLLATDLTGDGKADAAVASDSGAVAFFRQEGGTLKTAATLQGTASPRSLDAIDLEKDGKLDLMLASDGQVLVWRGTGSGSFTATPPYSRGKTPAALALGDVDRDGRIDAVVAMSVGSSVATLLHAATGELALADYVVTVPSPTAVALASLDPENDAFVDVEVASDELLDTLAGDGGGQFMTVGSGSAVTPVSGVTAIALGPLDTADSYLDAVTANTGSNNVSVYLNDGFGWLEGDKNYPCGLGPVAVAVARLNDDTRPDIVTANSLGDDVSLLMGTSLGFAAAKALTVGTRPVAVVAVDLDGDSRLDLVTANQGSDNVSVLLNMGGGMFAAAVAYAVGRSPSAVAASDLDGDGRPDVVVACRDDGTVHVLSNAGGGKLAASRPFPTAAAPTAVACADLNGDGRIDVATLHPAGGTMQVLFNATK